MRILLDNCVDRKIRSILGDYAVRTAVEVGCAELANGELLARAAEQFDLLVSSDKNIRHQHNLDELPIAVLELNTRRNRFKDFIPLQAKLAEAILLARLFRFVSINDAGAIECLSPRNPG